MVSDGRVDDEARAWIAAAARPEVETAVSEVLDSIAERVRALRPHCLASGNCCRFEAHGHRLYASGLEVARCVALSAQDGLAITLGDVEAATAAGNCPWQLDRLCTAREGRPTGCRVYYCDPRLAEAVPELAERTHARIRDLHDRFAVPYAYGEWRAMLARVIAAAD